MSIAIPLIIIYVNVFGGNRYLMELKDIFNNNRFSVNKRHIIPTNLKYMT